MKHNKKLGDKIYDLRKQKKISQEVLADIIGVTRQTVSQWEANRVRPKLDKLQLISDALGVKVNDLMSNKEEPEANVAEESEVAADVEVASDEIVQNTADDSKPQLNNTQEPELEQTKKRKKRKLSKKAKIAIISVAISIVVLIGLIAILVGYYFGLNHQGSFDGTKSSTNWYFSLENIGWIVFGVSIAIAVIIGIILICKFIRNRKSKHETDDVKS